ncbi:MAG: sigma-70 family RNA polymerase sigma factor, partial [Breznakibacter sp.]|nr:sigma-70 family RNA polymerase sigma factor [Breznakibacter sp.]
EARLVYFGSEQRDGLRLMVLNEDRVEIEKAIDELPEKCREVFKLSYLYGLKNKDIADALQLSLRTVEAHIYKALKFLRERLVGLVSMVVCFFSVIRF